MHTVLSIQRKQNLKDWLLLLKSVIVLLIYYFWLHFHAGKCQLLQCIFQTENADKALKYRLYRHLPAYEKIIRNLVSFYMKKLSLIGLWHRHPGSFDHFSSTDDGTNSKYARMRKEGAISALVNIDPEFRLTMYHVSQPCKYTTIEYDVGNHLIPDELLQYKSPERFEK